MMRNIIFYTLLGLLMLLAIPTVSAFTTERGNEIELWWGLHPVVRNNITGEWIPRVDHANGTTHYGHFTRVFQNKYIQWIPYRRGIIFNGIKIPRGYFAYRQEQRVSMFNVPIGNRNMKEFGECRAYEIRKGVCSLK